MNCYVSINDDDEFRYSQSLHQHRTQDLEKEHDVNNTHGICNSQPNTWYEHRINPLHTCTARVTVVGVSVWPVHT